MVSDSGSFLTCIRRPLLSDPRPLGPLSFGMAWLRPSGNLGNQMWLESPLCVFFWGGKSSINLLKSTVIIIWTIWMAILGSRAPISDRRIHLLLFRGLVLSQNVAKVNVKQQNRWFQASKIWKSTGDQKQTFERTGRFHSFFLDSIRFYPNSYWWNPYFPDTSPGGYDQPFSSHLWQLKPHLPHFMVAVLGVHPLTNLHNSFQTAKSLLIINWRSPYFWWL